MKNLNQYFTEMRDDLGINIRLDTFSEGIESWTVVAGLKDQVSLKSPIALHSDLLATDGES